MATFVHGRNGYLSLGGTDVTSITTDASRPLSSDTAETSVFGQTAKTYVPGMTDGTLSATARFDRTLVQTIEAYLGTEIAVVYGPEGNSTGDVSYTFQGIMTQFDIAGSTSDVVSASISIQRTGDTTISVF